MTGGHVTARTENFFVKSKSYIYHGATFEIADVDQMTPVNDKCNISNCDPQPSERLSTADLISAVGYAWAYASKPLSLLLPKSDATCKSEVIREGGILHYSTDEGTSCAVTSAGDKPCSFYYLSSKEKSTEFVEKNQEYSKGSYGTSFWRIVLARSTLIEEISMEDCLYSAEIPSSFGSMYNWMSKIAFYKPKDLVNSVELESKRTADFSDDCFAENSGSGCVIGNECSSFQSLSMRVSASKPEVREPLDLSSNNASKFDLKPSIATCSDEKDVMLPAEATYCEISTLRCDADSEDTKLNSHSCDRKDSINESRKGTYENLKDRGSTFVKADHAFAGAMAGIFVSLCLHPVDTVKTVIQSCHTSQKPVHDIGRSIIAERGTHLARNLATWRKLMFHFISHSTTSVLCILGKFNAKHHKSNVELFRYSGALPWHLQQHCNFGSNSGISSNIVTSAPISALYTLTYESVKKSLLPLLTKEYHSVAHCTAGACASIATSCIFTPSERIKQQMQVNSHYRNCWTALIQVLQKGGLPSLYTGWRAVLCRNVPHSVIKFYTYESLKQIMLPSIQQNARANILMTLVCGGLAGSTASLFTTPFDVVKTRLQTQVPGSMTKHSGVLSTLNEIWKHEGLNGVYRGLTPRLVMYMIQGALFFASYESFKSLFSHEPPQLSAQTF